jgi:predicted ATPase
MTRLLTLTGAGGCGKTRLALKVATDLVALYPDGVWLVELAGLAESELVPQAVAEALRVREQPGRPLVETLADYLRAKKVLLVVDNFEHLIDSAAHLVDFLLGSCPHLKVVATSGEPPGVEGEVLFSVSPLSVPAELPTDTSKIEDHDSVRLFVERTRMRLPGFSLTQENATAAAKVCKRLEGIPLAIELAAARMGLLATEQVAQRFEDSLGLLTAGPRMACPRQRTMRAAIGWSYGLLTEGKKKMFARLSAFAGGFTLEAAEAVCDRETPPPAGLAPRSPSSGPADDLHEPAGGADDLPPLLRLGLRFGHEFLP